MNNWQPIETAPKTRTAILLHCKGSRCTFAAYWREWDDVPGWFVFGANNRRLEQQPTHWMPLPEPPA